MELDKRIKALTDIHSVTSFCNCGKINKKGYFANSIFDFKELKRFCAYGEYTEWREHNQCFLCEQAGDKTYYSYFLPEDSLLPEEKPEKKYRPYTIKDFEKAFSNGEFEDFIILRDKHNNDDIYTMRYNGNFKKGQSEYICLGAKNFSFTSLFENYEVMDYDGDWQPFGVEDKE